MCQSEIKGKAMIGITGYGVHIPRLRLSRKAVVDANAWYAPNLASKATGTRTMANWDEDSITMAVAAARDCLKAGSDRQPLDRQPLDRQAIRDVYLASATLPFAERLNSGVVCAALNLSEGVEALDFNGSQRVALSALSQAISKVKSYQTDTKNFSTALVVAADNRKTRPASSQELDFGDGAAALLIGADNVLAEYMGAATLSVDFIDHFRLAGEEIDYFWEERWVRDEGIGKLVPQVIAQALENSNVTSDQIDHFIFSSTFPKVDLQIAKVAGIRPTAVAKNLIDVIGETGASHAFLMLAHVLERAIAGQHILIAQFGSGAQAMIFRVTDSISCFKPAKGVSLQLATGMEERSYTKFLSFKEQIRLERGMRGEQDKKTALSTAYRHRTAILGLVAGKCSVTGSVHFPPSRLSYDQGACLQDTQEPYELADRRATVLSWSAEYLSFHMAPPHQYGQIDFEGGGRILMDFTDLDVGEVQSGAQMELVFRIKDKDELRGFTRYFWKATPCRSTPQSATE
jgi:3-hydroxy-3-methylglutaryl CoA synthase